MFFIVSCTLSQNVCYLLFFAFRSGPGQLVLYKIPGVTIIHWNPIKWCRRSLCLRWHLWEAGPTAGPFPITEGWQLHGGLLKACGTVAQGKKSMQPEIFLPAAHFRFPINAVLPLQGVKMLLSCPTAAHTTARSSLHVKKGGWVVWWGAWVTRKGTGCPVGSIPWCCHRSHTIGLGQLPKLG